MDLIYGVKDVKCFLNKALYLYFSAGVIRKIFFSSSSKRHQTTRDLPDEFA
jgi:hypothetical protein